MKKLLLGLAVAGVLAAGFFLVNKTPQKSSEVKINDEPPQNPWVEILQGEVAELNGDGAIIRSLKSGDKVLAGNVIEIKKDGFANVYFPDGSVARLSGATKLLIEGSKFDAKTAKLEVRLKLLAGRLWSKVVGLATSDSVWEVRTSNAVATVRGTAFGVEAADGKSRIIGADHKIEVVPIDKKTGKLIQEAKVELSENKFVEVRDEAIAAAAAMTGQQASKAIVASMLVKEVTKEMLSEDWIKRNLAADKDLDKKSDVRKAVQNTRNEVYQEIKELKQETLDSAEVKTEVKIIQPEEKTKSPESLIISSGRDLKVINEGETVLLRAILIFSDGSKQDITDSVLWKVIGPIGGIVKPGVFSAKLSPEVSEVGEGSGAVTAIWKDPQTGEVLLGKTQIFKVEMEIDLNFDPTRG